MSSPFITVLLWAAALSTGLISGVYFAFSTFIMQSFRSIDATHAITSMQAINDVILRSLFMPLFFGSSIISVLLMLAAFFQWGEAGAGLMLIAGAVYFIGMFVCTAVFNVPLNNLLAKQDLANTAPNITEAQDVWARYLKDWTRWNHLRTVCSLVSCALCIWGLSH